MPPTTETVKQPVVNEDHIAKFLEYSRVFGFGSVPALGISFAIPALGKGFKAPRVAFIMGS